MTKIPFFHMKWDFSLIAFIFVLFAFSCSHQSEFRSSSGETDSSSEREEGPEAASRWRERVMRDEQGRIPFDGRIEALRQLDANLEFNNRSDLSVVSAPIWTARGPFDRGGRARSLVIHPQDSRTLWAAAGSGGLWKSEDGGTSWRPLVDRLGLPAGCLVIDPRNPERLYFGTGERFHSGGPGAGIYVTNDGGETWVRLSATRNWRYVPSIAISPTNSNHLIAAVADPESTTHPGVYHSTNAGQSWSRVLQGNFYTPSTITFQPGSGSRVLLSVREGLFPNNDVRVMYSDDGGLTWHRSSGVGTTQFTRYEIAYSKSQPQIAYAISREGVYRSDDGGTSFVQRLSGFEFGFVSWATMIWVSPNDPNLLLAGGVSLGRSRDGGVSWERIDYSDTRNRDIGHLDFQAAVADPKYNGASNRIVYLLNDGGIDRIDDVQAKPLGPRVAASLDRGMQTTEYYAVAGHANGGPILGGTQDRGMIRSQIGSNRSVLEMGGDGVCALIDPSDPRYQYGCGQFLWISRLQPNGLIGLTNDLPDSNPSSNMIVANFQAPVVLDPNKTSRMLGGGASLWRSENVRNATHDVGQRAKWVAIKRPLPIAFLGDDSRLISAIAIAKGDSNDIWVGHNDGRLFRTRNGTSSTPNWLTIDDNASRNPLPNRYNTRIVIDSSNRRRAFVSFGGFSPDNVWRTDNGGTNWRTASGQGSTALPKAPIWSIVQHPQKPNTIVAGTEVGVYITNDSGQKWTAIRAPITAAAQDLTFLQGSSTLLVGTFGRGIWTVDLD